MDDLFRDFWWLLFPIAVMARGAFRAWLDYRARHEVVKTLRDLAETGREPSSALLNQLNR